MAAQTGEFVIFLVNFADDPREHWGSKADVMPWAETEARYWEENTYKNLLFPVVRVLGYYTIPTECNAGTLRNTVTQLAIQRGDLPATSVMRLLGFLRPHVCGGNVGESFRGSNWWWSIALGYARHEASHALGFNHAYAWMDDGGVRYFHPYGDPADPVGGGAGHTGAGYKSQNQWFAPSDIQIVTATGQYWIDAYELAPTGRPKVLRIGMGKGEMEFPPGYIVPEMHALVTYRTQTGFDVGVPGGVNIHGHELARQLQFAVDLSPVHNTQRYDLAVGESFRWRNTTFRTLQVEPTRALVQVTFEEVTVPPPLPPPPSGQWVEGRQVVVNGQTWTFSDVIVGHFGSFVATMRDFVHMGSGIADPNDPRYIAHPTLGLYVKRADQLWVKWLGTAWDTNGVPKPSGDVTPPPVDTVPPTVSVASTVTYSFTASPADAVGVTRVEFALDGVLVQTAVSAPYTFTTSSVAPGAHTLTVRAYDAAGNVGTTTYPFTR